MTHSSPVHDDVGAESGHDDLLHLARELDAPPYVCAKWLPVRPVLL